MMLVVLWLCICPKIVIIQLMSMSGHLNSKMSLMGIVNSLFTNLQEY